MPSGQANTAIPKILIIDDDELIRLTCRNILKKIECDVIEAENGVQGLAQFKKERPSIVITDLLMPDKEGLETISEIKGSDKSVRIIAISGGGSTNNMSFLNIAKLMGADIILKKPFKPDELLGAIKTLL
jgi:DNA-binding response OmpR family regulator